MLLQSGAQEGNVRGLQHQLYRAVLFAASEWLAVGDFSTVPAAQPAAQAGSLSRLGEELAQALEGGNGPTLPQFVAACEEQAIRQALESSRSQQEAARRLGITESGLRKKMDKYGIARVRATRA